MSRRESREKAFMFLYQLEIQKGDATRQLADFLTEREVGEMTRNTCLPWLRAYLTRSLPWTKNRPAAQTLDHRPLAPDRSDHPEDCGL